MISPDGCHRLEVLKPFWILPSLFQPQPDPHQERAPKWLQTWGYPGFYRLLNHRSGELIEQSRIYDLEFAGDGIHWGGQLGTVTAGLITLGPETAGCTTHPATRPDPNQ